MGKTVRVALCFAFTAALIAVGPQPASASPAQAVPAIDPQAGATPGDPGSDQMIVRFESGKGPASAGLQASGGDEAEVVRRMDDGAWVLRLPEVYSRPSGRALAAAWTARDDVASAEPDARMYPLITPDDARYGEQWNMAATAPGNYTANVQPAWALSTGASSVVVAVIDSGYTDHADLAGRFLPGYDFIATPVTSNDGDGRDADPHDPGDWVTTAESEGGGPLGGCPVRDTVWHGTHISGTIGAASNNGIGVAGVNWTSKMVPVRVLGKCGGYISDISDGVRWAAGLSVSGVPANPNPASIINMSLGGGGSCIDTYQSAISAATAAGSLVVVAAANNAYDVALSAPANCKDTLTVAATAQTGDRATYSNYGDLIDIAAPGGDPGIDPQILSAWDTGLTSPAGDTYAAKRGTSTAAPHVSGIASLVKSVNPTATPAEIAEFLRTTVTPFPSGSTCIIGKCGAGIVNASAAVAAAQAKNGFLRVTTAPAVPSMITVDGKERDEFGLNWVPFPAGSHQVCFGPVAGYATPSCQTVNVTPGVTTTVNGSFTQLGFLRVTTSPALPSTVLIDGVAVNEYGAWIPTTAGSHTVCFGNVEQFDVPACSSVSVTAGATTTSNGTFTANPSAPGPAPGFGYLRVTTNPPVAATVLVDGVARDPWGLNWLKIAPGSHEVCFAPYAGASGPACQNAVVTAGATATVEGTFNVKDSLRVLTDPPVNATVMIDGVVADSYGAWRTASVGLHYVCFGDVPGFVAPGCRPLSVNYGAFASTTGTYTPT